MTATDAGNFLKDNAIRYVLAQFVDIHAAAKTKAIPVAHFENLISIGAGFAGVAISGLGIGPNGPEYMAVCDVSTLTRDWRAAANSSRSSTWS